jgi:hypothetical protein
MPPAHGCTPVRRRTICSLLRQICRKREERLRIAIPFID